MRILFIIIILFISGISYSQLSRQSEVYYKDTFALILNGKTEVLLNDQSRADIVTDSFAIEVDFANHWAESIGQSLYYSKKLNKKAGVLLIINGGVNDNKDVKRLMIVALDKDICVWLINYNTNKWCRVSTKFEYSYKF